MPLTPTALAVHLLNAVDRPETQQPSSKVTQTPFKAPNPPPSPPPGLSDPINTITAWGKYGVLVCGVAGLLICGGQMAIGRKNRSSFAADGATGVPWVLGGLSLVATAASIVEMFVR